MTNVVGPTILVIVGITGDLARRKLLPAIEEIAKSGSLPSDFRVIGVTRQQINPTAWLTEQEASGQRRYPFLKQHLEIFSMDLDQLASFVELKKYLHRCQKKYEVPCQQLFYLAIPPQISAPVVRLLGESGIAVMPNTKLLAEKPFGSDLDSARSLVKHIRKYFDEDQVYRIDHYLAKEMAQNILVFRNGNSLFKQTWNRKFIEKIEIVATEKIGIEGRAAFYEQTGALRDVVQSHLLQLAALVLMELPAMRKLSRVPHLRYKALAAIDPPPPDKLDELVIRGQYQGYATEVKNPGSSVETFVSMTMFSKDRRWKGVPIVLTTGKALADKKTEIRIHFRQQDADEANELVLRIQPNEGIGFDVWIKQPGYHVELQRVPLAFAYSDHFSLFPEAYEQVIFDAMRSEHTLFTSSAEVLASWKIIDPILHAWSLDSKTIKTYQIGSQIDQIA